MNTNNIIAFPGCGVQQSSLVAANDKTNTFSDQQCELTQIEVWQAISEKRVVVHYQPQHEMITGNLVGVEALVRLADHDGNLIYPDRFIDMVEDCGLINMMARMSVVAESVEA